MLMASFIRTALELAAVSTFIAGVIVVAHGFGG